MSRRDSVWRIGGVGLPFEVKGRLPLRCEDVPLEFARAIEGVGADCCEKVRCGGTVIPFRS